ncbi:MAG: hypothetical protein J1E98_14625 [Lachnospiraceae bacterium]|nr:hypothetical protein [Lachnospiraceae bacterium]
MARTPNRYGGGAQTNRNGLYFEQTTSLNEALICAGYEVRNHVVYIDGYEIGMSVPQTRIYSHFLEPHGIDYADYNSKAWRPDEAFINYENSTAYIIEKKFQNRPGSVDEKLPSCHFKKWEYEKLFEPLEYDVEFIYIFNDWFRAFKYRDTLEYIERMGCYYFYNEIPLYILGL